MKAIKTQIQKHSRWTAMLLAAVVAILTSIVVANATQTITTPNAASISYNLAPGATSAAITPTPNKPVLVMGCATNINPSVGQVSLLHIPGVGLDWAGLESADSLVSTTTTTTTAGRVGSAGIHIVWIDGAHSVEIKTASADTILVHNGNGGFTMAGNVTLIW